jgi:hypothetical protein
MLRHRRDPRLRSLIHLQVLRSGATSFEYEREVQPRPKLGRWTEELDAVLAGNPAKPVREQLTLIRIFEELRGRGYDGGYDAVLRYARRWAKHHGQATAAAYVPLSFAPGEAYQFDWSHEVVLLSGVTVIVKVAHVRLCHSRMLFVRASFALTGVALQHAIVRFEAVVSLLNVVNLEAMGKDPRGGDDP